MKAYNKKNSICIFGASGMLGSYLKSYFSDKYLVHCYSSEDCDFSRPANIRELILRDVPRIVINCSACINLERCEEEPEYAFLVNGKAVSDMALACNEIGSKLVQISTDHYYINNSNKRSSEEAGITLINEYAKTKFFGEVYARLANDFLIIRTNIIGFSSKKQTFMQWVLKGVKSNDCLKLYEDYYTSPISICFFSEILDKCLKINLKGLYNIASRDVVSKADFIEKVAFFLGVSLDNSARVSMLDESQGVKTKRANTLGLDVEKIEKALGVSMPTVEESIVRLLRGYKNGK